MEFSEAAELIERYHKAIKDLRPEGIVQSYECLPCTSGRLKYAHYIYGEEIIKNELLSESIVLLLIESYGLIDSLFSQNSEEENFAYRSYINNLREQVVTDYDMPNPFGESDAVLEYFNFIGETAFRLGLPNFEPEHFPGLVYQELMNKAKRENNLNLLVALANSSLTRSVPFPNKKKNDECSFI